MHMDWVRGRGCSNYSGIGCDTYDEGYEHVKKQIQCNVMSPSLMEPS